jgi:hypothetical protein
MKHIARTCALGALILSSAAAAGSIDVQPSLYLHYDFAGAHRASALHWGAELNWGERTLDALARRLDADSGRSTDLQSAARRGMRELMPALLHLELSDVRDLDLRVDGQSLLGWRLPLLNQNDGGAGEAPEDSGFHWSSPWTIASIVAGVGATVALSSRSDVEINEQKDNNSGQAQSSSQDGCTVVGGDPVVVSDGCKQVLPGGG